MLTLKDESLEAIGHRLLIEVEKIEEKIGDFIIAADPGARRKEEIAKEIGTIISMGPTAFDGRAIDDDTIKVGDKIIFKRYAGVHLELAEKDIRIINDDDCYAKVKEGK